MKSKKMIAQIAATYIGTVVGAGFATGQEILRFFTVHGIWGTAGVIISCMLFLILGTKMMILSRRIGAYSFQEFNIHLFGKPFGTLINCMIFIMLLGVTATMLSGTGAIFREHLGLPQQLGIIMTLLLSYIIIKKGLSGVFTINSLIVPTMVFFICIILFNIDWREVVQYSTQSIPLNNLRTGWSAWKWLFDALAYAAFNVAMAQAVLVPIGNEVKNERVLILGGIWGGGGLGLMLLANHFALLTMMPQALTLDIPMAFIVKSLGPIILPLYLIVIYGEILTTLIGNVFGITRQIQQSFAFKETSIILWILFTSFLISQVGFSALVTHLYPIFGYTASIILIALLCKKIPA